MIWLPLNRKSKISNMKLKMKSYLREKLTQRTAFWKSGRPQEVVRAAYSQRTSSICIRAIAIGKGSSAKWKSSSLISQYRRDVRLVSSEFQGKTSISI